MELSDAEKKLLEIFSAQIEVRKPDFDLLLSRPLGELEAAREEASALLKSLIRPERAALDPQAVGRARFPELQGTLELFADGLANHPDIVAEISASPEMFLQAIALDQALGRFIFAAQLLAAGSDTGDVLAGAAAQKLAQDVLTQARNRSEDESVPPDTRSDISIAFSEATRLEEEDRQRELQAKAISNKSAQPYHSTIDQANADATLAEVVDAYMRSVLSQKGGHS